MDEQNENTSSIISNLKKTQLSEDLSFIECNIDNELSEKIKSINSSINEENNDFYDNFYN